MHVVRSAVDAEVSPKCSGARPSDTELVSQIVERPVELLLQIHLSHSCCFIYLIIATVTNQAHGERFGLFDNLDLHSQTLSRNICC